MNSKANFFIYVVLSLVFGLAAGSLTIGMAFLCGLGSMAGPVDNTGLIFISIFGVVLTAFITRNKSKSLRICAQVCFILPIGSAAEFLRVALPASYGNFHMEWRLVTYLTLISSAFFLSLGKVDFLKMLSFMPKKSNDAARKEDSDAK